MARKISNLVTVRTIAEMMGRPQLYVQRLITTSTVKANGFPAPISKGYKNLHLYQREQVEAWIKANPVTKRLDNTLAQQFIRGKIGSMLGNSYSRQQGGGA